MMPIKDNQDVACFFVTKHSWKGKLVEYIILPNVNNSYSNTFVDTNEYFPSDQWGLPLIIRLHWK